jgi:hypothetical protein
MTTRPVVVVVVVVVVVALALGGVIALAGLGMARGRTAPDASSTPRTASPEWCADPAGVGRTVRAVDEGIEVHVYAPRRRAVAVRVHDPSDGRLLAREELVRTDAPGGCQIWRGTVATAPGPVTYDLDVDGTALPDPWSSSLDPTGRLSVFDPGPAPAPGPDEHRLEPGAPMAQVHVAASTAARPDVAPEDRCRFRGVLAEIPGLAELGVRSVHLLPVTATVGPRAGEPVDRQPCGVSGSPSSAPPAVVPKGYDVSSLAAPAPTLGTRDELRTLVTAFNEAGIGVVLDAVFTHTGLGSLLEVLDADTYLDFDGSGAADLDDAGDADAGPYGPRLAVHDPTVRALVAGALERFVTETGVDGFRLDNLASSRSATRDLTRDALAIVELVLERHPGLDLVVEGYPLEPTGRIAEEWWQEDASVSDAVNGLLAGVDAGALPADLGDRVGAFEAAAVADPAFVPRRRVVYVAHHDRAGTAAMLGAHGRGAEALDAAALALLAVVEGRPSLAPGAACGPAAATPVGSALSVVGGVRAEAVDVPCPSPALVPFVAAVAGGSRGLGPDRTPPRVTLPAARAVVVERAGWAALVNLGSTAVVFHQPICVGRVHAALGPVAPAGSCWSELPGRSVALVEAHGRVGSDPGGGQIAISRALGPGLPGRP